MVTLGKSISARASITVLFSLWGMAAEATCHTQIKVVVICDFVFCVYLTGATAIGEYGESFDTVCDTKHGTAVNSLLLCPSRSVKGEGHNSKGKGVTLS